MEIQEKLPVVVNEYIESVIKKMRYKKKVRAEVREELCGHFADALKGCADENKEQTAKELIEGFGDARILAILIRRGKKRNRPMWKKTIIGCVKGIGILFVLFFVYLLWFISGTPEISVDYLEVLNNMGRPDVSDADNAWIDYQKAADLYTEENKEKIREIRNEIEIRADIKEQIEKLTEEQRATFYKWLNDNKPAWEEFVKGDEKPYAYREYGFGGAPEREERWMLEIMMPHLAPMKNICKIGAWSALIDAEEGRFEEGLSKCISIVKAGRHLKGSVILIEQLVGIAMESIGYKVMMEIASENDLSLAMLEKLNGQLVEIYEDGYPNVDMEGERLFFLDSVQQMYTKGGPGGGHVVPSRFQDVVSEFSLSTEENGWFVKIVSSAPVGTVMASRNEILKKGNEIHDHLKDMANYSPYQRKMGSIRRVNDIVDELSFRYTLIMVFFPAVEKVIDHHYRSKANYEATLTVIALLRYEKEKGNLPVSLEALVEAGYLKSVPTDPYSDGELVYKKTDDGFTLYSVGDNFTDDDGEYGTKKNGDVRQWGENGDAVFWPVR